MITGQMINSNSRINWGLQGISICTILKKSLTLSGETLSGEIIRRAKFWSLSDKFVTFARRKIRNLSYFMRTQYNLHKIIDQLYLNLIQHLHYFQ